MKQFIRLILFLFCLESHHLWAEETGGENSDLDLIPKTLDAKKEEVAHEKHSPLSGKAFLEDALTGWANHRRLLVPVPNQAPAWQNRTSLDFDYNWRITEKIKLSLSNRLNFFEGDTITFPSGENVRNDFREGFITYELFPRTYVDFGRINLKNGVALGYNPTDFLKSRTTVNIASIDPSAQRENRLGSLMVEVQKIWDDGALTLAYSPRVQRQSPLLISQRASFDPLFSQTNSDNRFLASLSYNIADLNPQILVFYDHVGTHIGANISRVMSSSIVGYLEWSGVREASLTKRAVTFGQDTGSLPQGAPLLPQTDTRKSFQNDLAIGASWTSSFRLTVNLEYHYHQAGFGAQDFKDWISRGNTNSQLASELWFIRQYAADQQEPLTQHEIFLRFDWQDFIPSKLNIGAVMFVSPYDGSIMAQASAQYFLSRNWTLGMYVGGILGSTRTVEGSLPSYANGVLQIVRYL
jgi:hypothetical protein